MSDDLTVHILTEIRDEIRGVREEVRVTNERLDQTRTELKAEIAQTRTELKTEIAGTRDEMGHRIVEVDLRVATAITGLTASTRDLHDLIKERFDLRDRVERCEHEIDELKKKVG